MKKAVDALRELFGVAPVWSKAPVFNGLYQPPQFIAVCDSLKSNQIAANVFFSYQPDVFSPHDELMKNREFFCENYDLECMEIFDRAYDLNKNDSTSVYRKIRKIGRIDLKGRL